MSKPSVPSVLRSILRDRKTRDLLRDLLDQEILKAEVEEKKKRNLEELARVAVDLKTIKADRTGCQTSFYEFVKRAWRVLEPETDFVDNWHIKAICDHLQAVTEGKITRLLINVPPGSMKSLLVAVFWPAWEWAIGRRAMRYITTAFSEDATLRDTRKMRDLVLSEWYQNRWPEVRLVRKGDTGISNTGTGYRECSPFGSLTSKRGDRLIIDDPHSVKTAESDAERNKTTRDFREGALNRLNDQKRSAIIVIMQRLHPDDISGVILALGLGYVHLCLPMEFEVANRCKTVIGFVDPRTKEGELLDPVRFSREVIDSLKKGMGDHAYAGQYQQRPTAREGGLFKRANVHYVDVIPPNARYQSAWDLAATAPKQGTSPDYSVRVKMAVADGHYYIVDVKRFRMGPNETRAQIKATAIEDGKTVPVRLPQDPGQAGKAQASDFIALLAGWIVKTVSVSGRGDKGTRAEPFASQWGGDNVFLKKGDWNEALLDELASFPIGHDDQLDACADAFAELADDGTSDIVIPAMRRDNPNQIG